MKYSELTINQKISLKGEFMTDKSLENYRIVWIIWGYVKAVEYFLNDDLSELPVFI